VSVPGSTKQNRKVPSPDSGSLLMVFNPICPIELTDAVESIDVKLLRVSETHDEINIEWW